MINKTLAILSKAEDVHTLQSTVLLLDTHNRGRLAHVYQGTWVMIPISGI